jgi:hypothetical protein
MVRGGMKLSTKSLVSHLKKSRFHTMEVVKILKGAMELRCTGHKKTSPFNLTKMVKYLGG